MPMMPSKIHGSRNWWHVVYHENGKGEKAHFHVNHGEAKVVIMLDTLEFIHDSKELDKKERKEILKAVKEYMLQLKLQQRTYGVVGGFDNNQSLTVKLILLFEQAKSMLLNSKNNDNEKVKKK